MIPLILAAVERGDIYLPGISEEKTMSNYPPGVTGREFAIAGDDWETEKNRVCEDCKFTGEVLVSSYESVQSWECPDCHTAHEDYDDPDADFERVRDNLFDD